MTLPSPSPRQARLIWLALTGLAVAVLVALVAALIWGLGQVLEVLAPVLWPLAVAAVLALLLDPVVDWLERRGLKRAQAIGCVFGLALLLLVGLFASIVPQVVNETRQLAIRIPVYAARLQDRVEDWLAHPPQLLRKLLERENTQTGTNTILVPAVSNQTALAVSTNVTSNGAATSTNSPALLSGALDKQALQTAGTWLAKTFPKIGSWLFGQVGRVASWFGVLAALALIPVYTFYFLTEKHGISARWTDYLPVADSGFKQELVFVLNSINNYLIAFFRC